MVTSTHAQRLFMPMLLRFTFLFLLLPTLLHAQSDRWRLNPAGGITWEVKTGEAHEDHLEMSGKFLSSVVRYGVETDGSFYCRRDIVWPMLRTIPNNTHASLTRSFQLDYAKLLTINKKPVLKAQATTLELNGILSVIATLPAGCRLQRWLFPSADKPFFCEKFQLANASDKPVIVEIPEVHLAQTTNAADGAEGSYVLRTESAGHGVYTVAPGATQVFYLTISGARAGDAPAMVDVEQELANRQAFLSFINQNLVLETPDTVLNRAFAFAKIRASESIYQTKGGPMHGPGGLSYYAAIWANDQAEYINPFFPYLGYDYGVASALNAYRHFARFMNPDYNPIPSSIIAEGIDIWNGAGDRGDAAMIAYGAARFALTQGDQAIAQELWPLIEWCLEYNKRHLNAAGVVRSDCDELENRFPAGEANLCTSSLYYDALNSAVYLGKALGKDKKQLAAYGKEAAALRANIERYFGANMAGFDTYRYYAGNDKLRAWICIPLTVNIFDRAKGTIDALFSPELWTADGLASLSGDKTFWDRSTLYALRGVLAAGQTERGLPFLQYYSRRRLLGEHVPYPVEAYPEGNQRHLSAESGLYCRVYTEGLFGLRPVGLNTFQLTPRLPDGWNHMSLRQVHGFQKSFDITVLREKNQLRVTVISEGRPIFDQLIENGQTAVVLF